MRQRRRRTRGAVLVEGLIVVTFFITIAFGLIWFKSMLLARVKGLRYSRAGALEYAMGGCQNGDPGAGVASMVAADKGTVQGSTVDSQGAQNSGVPPLSTPDVPGVSAGAAQTTMSNLAGNIDELKGLTLNISTLSLGGSVTMPAAGPNYNVDFSTSSYVGCADEVTYEQNMSSILEKAKKIVTF